MQNYRLTLCYDGTRYNGWQRQGNTPDTIQGKLETLLSRLLDQPIEVAGSGRTDAGVHAAAQVASFRADTDMTCGELLAAIRRYLPEDIGAIALEPAEPRFHARLSCTGKTYVYRIWNSDAPCVFQRRYVTVVPGDLDLSAMERAAGHLLGTHDFMTFCGNRRRKKSTVRTVDAITVSPVAVKVDYTVDSEAQWSNSPSGQELEEDSRQMARYFENVEILLTKTDGTVIDMSNSGGSIEPKHGITVCSKGEVFDEIIPLEELASISVGGIEYPIG